MLPDYTLSVLSASGNKLRDLCTCHLQEAKSTGYGYINQDDNIITMPLLQHILDVIFMTLFPVNNHPYFFPHGPESR